MEGGRLSRVPGWRGSKAQAHGITTASRPCLNLPKWVPSLLTRRACACPRCLPYQLPLPPPRRRSPCPSVCHRLTALRQPLRRVHSLPCSLTFSFPFCRSFTVLSRLLCCGTWNNLSALPPSVCDCYCCSSPCTRYVHVESLSLHRTANRRIVHQLPCAPGRASRDCRPRRPPR